MVTKILKAALEKTPSRRLCGNHITDRRTAAERQSIIGYLHGFMWPVVEALRTPSASDVHFK